MNIGIIGGGSLGLLLTSYLSKHHDVTLYVRRRAQLHSIERQGVHLHRQHSFVQRVDVSCHMIHHLKDHDIMFITVKQPQIDDIIPYLSHLNQNCRLIFLQNGMGHLEKIKSLRSQVSVGVVEHGASRINDYKVDHLGYGTIKLAAYDPLTDKIEKLKEILHQDEFPFERVDDWQTLLTSKLLINAVINPLTALFNVPNGSVITNRHLIKLAKKLTDEAATVLQIEKKLAWNNVKRVAENTKANTSSMRADIIHHRETEIEAISGYLLRKASAHTIPNTSFVYEAILALQERGDDVER